MKIIRKIYVDQYLLFLLFIILGCSVVPPVFLVPDSKSKYYINTFYYNDHEIAVSNKQNSDILLYGQESDTQNDLFFHLVCINKSSNRIDVMPDKIKVFGFDKENKSKSLKVFTSREYIANIQTDHAWSMTFQALAGAVNAYQAGKSVTVGSKGASVTYDYGKAQYISQIEQNKLANQAEQNNVQINDLEQRLIKKHSLFAGESIEGDFVVSGEYVYSKKYLVEIPLKDEKHLVVFIPEDINKNGKEENENLIKISRIYGKYFYIIADNTDIYQNGDKYEIMRKNEDNEYVNIGTAYVNSIRDDKIVFEYKLDDDNKITTSDYIGKE